MQSGKKNSRLSTLQKLKNSNKKLPHGILTSSLPPVLMFSTCLQVMAFKKLARGEAQWGTEMALQRIAKRM